MPYAPIFISRIQFILACSTAPAVEPLLEYKLQNKSHSIKHQSPIVNSVAGATELEKICHIDS